MRSVSFVSDTMKDYALWNKALFEYFFPTRQEDPLLFVDDSLLEEIGTKQFESSDDDGCTWAEFFLSCVLFDEKGINDFRKDYNITDGREANTWNSIVSYLINSKPEIDEIPSYFAIICAIMYVAQKVGADRTLIMNYVNEYSLNTPISDRVDDLYTQLNKDCHSFNHNRMVSHRVPSTRVNISRIKYHLVLKKKEREDFIDFIEVNNLKWEGDTYKIFADLYLLPSLAAAKKNDIIAKIKNEENNPYFKNLLTLPSLQFGKPATVNNKRQIRDVYWRYELKFDFNTGNPIFLMTTNDTLGGISFDGKGFAFDSSCLEIAEPLGSDVLLQAVKDYEYTIGDNKYVLKNITSNKIIYFESAAQDYFHQIPIVVPGKHYLMFIPIKKRGQNTCPDGWEVVTDFRVDGYDIFETQNYQGKTICEKKNKDMVCDPYDFYHVGSYLRISLNEKEKVLWEPHAVGAKSQILCPIARTVRFSYYRIPYNIGNNCISGTILVKSADDSHILMSDNIYFETRWNSTSQKYYIDGWGNTVTDPPTIKNNNVTNATSTIQLSDKSLNSDILLNLLNELADKDGCLDSTRLKSAINFVLQLFGIEDPDYNNRKKVIYALRRLSYMIEKKEPNTGKYINQLVSPYVEKTRYRLTAPRSSNLYLIKGVYNSFDLKDFISQNNIRTVLYKRPYENRIGNLQFPGYNAENDSPEYKCLPDLLFFECVGGGIQKWNCLQSPYAYTLLSMLGDMKQFPQTFLSGEGDLYNGYHGKLPDMVTNKYNKEVICYKDKQEQIRTLKDYQDSNTQQFVTIPKHLSRVYCANEKGLPICIRKEGASADISFLHKMGIPRVLDMAFCDLNLGLPDEHKVFVINHATSGLPIKVSDKGEDIPYSDIKIYHNIDSTTGWLQKLSANNKKGTYAPSQYYNCWKMYLDSARRRIVLTRSGLVSAFTLNNKIYIRDNKTGKFNEVTKNKSVNEILSEILTSDSDLPTCPSSVIPPTTIYGLPPIDII